MPRSANPPNPHLHVSHRTSSHPVPPIVFVPVVYSFKSNPSCPQFLPPVFILFPPLPSQHPVTKAAAMNSHYVLNKKKKEVGIAFLKLLFRNIPFYNSGLLL